MKNKDFMGLLRDEGYSVEKLAAGIFSDRAHVNKVLRNWVPSDRTSYGKRTRRKLARFFATKFATAPAMLAVLGWDENGELRKCEKSQDVSMDTFHVEQGGGNG